MGFQLLTNTLIKKEKKMPKHLFFFYSDMNTYQSGIKALSKTEKLISCKMKIF